jgi:vacuolar-type H+-ATPase subunit D/Vma8
MGNSISKEVYEIERYKLILEIDELEKKVEKLEDELQTAERRINALQMFYSPIDIDRMSEYDFRRTWD